MTEDDISQIAQAIMIRDVIAMDAYIRSISVREDLDRWRRHPLIGRRDWDRVTGYIQIIEEMQTRLHHILGLSLKEKAQATLEDSETQKGQADL